MIALLDTNVILQNNIRKKINVSPDSFISIVTVGELESLALQLNWDGIKYFSGTASYSTTFTAVGVKKGEPIEIDLGEVKNLAEVILNGKSLGIVWKKPFKINASGALKAGKNTLEIKVTNLWVNRLIGDQQPNATKITYTTQAYYKADAPLLPSGLLGPVVLRY